MPSQQRYVSDELTHFVGRSLRPDEHAQYQLLVKILKDGWLKPRGDAPETRRKGRIEIDPSKALSSNECYIEYCVCFCDIPPECIKRHMSHYGRFGVAFTKDFLVDQGASPVLYIARDSVLIDNEIVQEMVEASLDPAAAERARANVENSKPQQQFKLRAAEVMDRMHHDSYLPLTTALIGNPPPYVSDRQRQAQDIQRVLHFHIFGYMKFFDHRLPEDDSDNHYMEREWRVVGNVKFDLGDLCRVIVPQSFQERLVGELPELRGKVSPV